MRYELKQLTGQKGIFICYGDGVAISNMHMSGKILISRGPLKVQVVASKEHQKGSFLMNHEGCNG